MNKTQVKRQANGDEANGKAAAPSERAMSDGTFRNRPLWRSSERPDHQYGPRLTLVARQLLAEERNYVADDHR